MTFSSQTRATHESHTVANTADLLQNAAHKLGIVVLTDNTSNMGVAIQSAAYLHVKCLAHMLNLASQRALNLPIVQFVKCMQHF